MTDIDDVQQLSDAIVQLLANPQMRDQLRDSAAQDYRQRFSREVVVNQYVDFYRRIARR